MRVMCNRAVSACKRKNMVKRSREQAESLRKSGRKSHLIMCDVMIFPTSEPDKSYQKNDTPSGMLETRAHGAAAGNSVF